MKTTIANQRPLIGPAACAGALLLLACSAPAQNLFVSGFTTGNIYEITPGGGSSPFTTGLSYPYGIAFNSAGDLFVANSDDNAGFGGITEITPGGAQSPFSSEADPIALAFDSAGDLFSADYSNGDIYKYTPGGAQSVFATGFSSPISLAVDSAGDVFVGAGYGGNGTITKITPTGTPSLFASGLSYPGGLAFNSAGNLFVSSQSSGAILEYTSGGTPSTFVTIPGTTLNGLAFNSAGNLFAGSGTGAIYEITPGGSPSTFSSIGANAAGLAFQPVPEPSVWGLLGTGALALLAARPWRRRPSASQI